MEKNAEVIGKATNDSELLELLSHYKPDLILMDIDLPKINGTKMIRKALELNPDLKIIALTMFGYDSYIRRLIQTGVHCFLLKSSIISSVENDIHYLLMDDNYSINNQLIKLINKFVFNESEKRVRNYCFPNELNHFTFHNK